MKICIAKSVPKEGDARTNWGFALFPFKVNHNGRVYIAWLRPFYWTERWTVGGLCKPEGWYIASDYRLTRKEAPDGK